jgi:hypothetical protein
VPDPMTFSLLRAVLAPAKTNKADPLRAARAPSGRSRRVHDDGEADTF